MGVSSAYITCKAGGVKTTWHFTGVTAIEHNLSLSIESTSSRGSDIVNGARNQADRITLAVVETDAEHGPGWAARMLEAMASLKKNRYLCRVVTSMGSYSGMLLSEIRATQDGENQDGWSGTLVFTEYMKTSSGTDGKAADNSSTRCNTGSAGSVTVLDGDSLVRVLQRAGVL